MYGDFSIRKNFTVNIIESKEQGWVLTPANIMYSIISLT